MIFVFCYFIQYFSNNNNNNNNKFSQRHVHDLEITSVTPLKTTDHHYNHNPRMENDEMGSREWSKTGKPFTG